MHTDLLESLTHGRPIRVLLVDDDQNYYILTRHQLSKTAGEKVKLDWADSYEKGLEEIKKKDHDVYLLDYRLGPHTGIELLQEAIAMGCKAPIIMLTTENPEVDAQAMRLGAADFLSKDKLDSSLLERSIRYSIKHYNTLRALREKEAQIDAFMENVPCAVYMKDLDGRYIFANEACAAVFRRKVEEVVGKTDAELLPKSAAKKARDRDMQAVEDKRAVESTETFNREDGTHYWLSTRFPIFGETGEPSMIGGASLDVTENKRLEREVQEISEQEKRRIGQDLHDGLGQYLTGVSFMVKVVEQKLASKGYPEFADVAKISGMVNETISQARDLARGLCPVELETNGLQAALQELANRITKHVGVPCELVAPQTTRVYDNAAAVHLYRIAQEAVNNGIKHGRAKNIRISLDTQNNQVVLTVKDDGIGIPKDKRHKPGGMGLRVMNYRAAIIGATVKVESAPNDGTLVTCTMANKPPAAAVKGKRKSKAGAAAELAAA